MSLRKASHAGSWYNESSSQLGKELGGYLEKATPDTAYSSARAIISPHAAFTYCGATGAYGFKCIDPSTVKTVFVLGPSHHKYLTGCALSKCKRYATPFYNLEIDTQIISTLHKSGMFEDFELDDDEAEHSLEMQLPFIAKIMEGHKDNFKIVPVVVGSTDPDQEREYGALFAPYLADTSVVFVISSDFCHWGSRFRYCYGVNDSAPIWQTITNLDKSGMDIIESKDPGAFEEYLSKYKNTICGRHPIGILLNMVSSYQSNNADKKCSIKFLDYSQSSQVTKRSDSSVSYASAALIIQ